MAKVPISPEERAERERKYQREYRRKRRANDPEFYKAELERAAHRWANDPEFRERETKRRTENRRWNKA